MISLSQKAWATRQQVAKNPHRNVAIGSYPRIREAPGGYSIQWDYTRVVPSQRGTYLLRLKKRFMRQRYENKIRNTAIFKVISKRRT